MTTTPQNFNPTASIQSISKKFGPVTAVSDVSFAVEKGEIFGLLGPNGAGKTTTIRMVLNIFKPDSGAISVLGGKMDEAKKGRIGYMPEERGLYQDQRLERVLLYLAQLKGVDKMTAKQRLDRWLERLDLAEHRQKKIEMLSKGMQQKAQLIATLLHEPDLIVVDEPFSGLDPLNTRLVKDILLEQAEAGRTIIMSTHQMHQVEALCNRIALIGNGRVVLYGDVQQIKRQYAGRDVVIQGKGDFTQIPGVVSHHQNGAWHLLLDEATSAKEVLRFLSNQPDVTVERFEIEQPSLEDIYVAVVQQMESAEAKSDG
jgi:ABC-2 type transport system ATP-binding protein